MIDKNKLRQEFREFLNEVKISSGSAFRYFDLIKKGLKSKTMNVSNEGNIMTVKYDGISLIFKDSYLVGFEENGEFFEVSKSLKSIKDLNNIKEIQKYFGKKVSSTRQMNVPTEPVYAYFPKDNKELRDLVKELIKERGNNADLNDIDVSGVTDMQLTFQNSAFNGDISKWNVSNVKDMYKMFYKSLFNGDISKWNVSKEVDMYKMFNNSPLSGNEPQWYHDSDAKK